MGLLDDEYDDSGFSFNFLDGLFDDNSDNEVEFYYDSDTDNSNTLSSIAFDWQDDDTEDIYTPDHFGLEFDSWNEGVTEDDDSGIMSMLGKVPGGVWDRLLDFGVAGLAEWLRQKNKTTKKGGGGGGRGPSAAATSTAPVGTRTKG